MPDACPPRQCQPLCTADRTHPPSRRCSARCRHRHDVGDRHCRARLFHDERRRGLAVRGLDDSDKSAVADALQTQDRPPHRSHDRCADRRCRQAAPGADRAGRTRPAQGGAERRQPDRVAADGIEPRDRAKRCARHARPICRGRSKRSMPSAARVHIAAAEPNLFVREDKPATASVILTLQNGRTLSDGQVQAIRYLVASSVPGMNAEQVSVIDQRRAVVRHRIGQRHEGVPVAGPDRTVSAARSILCSARARRGQFQRRGPRRRRHVGKSGDARISPKRPRDDQRRSRGPSAVRHPAAVGIPGALSTSRRRRPRSPPTPRSRPPCRRQRRGPKATKMPRAPLKSAGKFR